MTTFCLRRLGKETRLSLSVRVCYVASVVEDFCDPKGHSPPGSSVHGDSPGKTLE